WWCLLVIMFAVTRKNIICSKYMSFFLLFFLSILITFMLFYLANVFIFPTFTVVFFNYLLRGMGLILCVAALTFPLTYLLGIEKADSISMSSTIFALGMFFLVLIVLQAMIGTPENFDEIFSATFSIIAIVLFVVSYVVSRMIYM